MKMRIATLSLLTICCLMLAVARRLRRPTCHSITTVRQTVPSADIRLTSVSPCPTRTRRPAGSTINSVEIVYWDTSSTDILNATDVSFGSASFGNNLGQYTGATNTNTFLGVNPFGYNLYDAVISTPGMAGGSGWVSSGQRLHHNLWLHIPGRPGFLGRE